MLAIATVCPMTTGVGLMLFRTALGLLLASALTLAAQQPPAAPPADQSQTARFGAAASGVVVDVVVRDKQGPAGQQPRRGRLCGVSRTAFPRRSSRSSRTRRPTCQSVSKMPHARRDWWRRRPADTRRLAEGPPIIALAWDRLEPEGRAMAYKAARRLDPDQGAGRAGRRVSDRHDAADDPAVHDRQAACWARPSRRWARRPPRR